LEIYRSRKNLLFALVAFIIYALIGAVTTHLDPNFASVVLGQGYVDVTNENIANLNPLAIYEDDDQLAMFINITTNNLKVAFLTFFVGFFFTLGTHMLMFYNGVMLGTFQYFFHTKGLLVTSFLGIWIHGSFEISAIVLAGGAGITAGNGLLFPKSYTRIQSLQLSTKRGLKIMLSLVPFIIAAGFLESFVTANYQMLPDWSKWAIIIFSFALILFFYVFYPIYVARKYPELVYQEPVENFKPKTTFRFDKIRSVGDIIADSFRMYRLQFKKFTKIIFLIVFPLVIAAVWLQDINHYDLQQKQYWYDWSAQLELMIGYGYHNLQDVFMVVVWTFIFALMLTAVLWSVNTIGEEFSWKSFFAFVGKRLLGIWLANIFLMLLIMTLPSWGLMLAVFVMPFFMLNGAAAGLDDEKFGVRFKRGFKYSAQHYGKSLLVLLILIGLTVIMMQPIAFVFSIHDGWSNEPMVRDVLDMVADFTKRIAQIYTDDYMFWANVLRQLVYVLFMLFLLPLLFITMSFGYYSELEKTEANGLKNAFKKFGKRSRTKETSVDFE
ncbi:MAG: stage II sporulation protein M, partial [Crocinitomicaceae bacterium]|nr:stage II sporulation protein M [Crocinitomicaceae bacterium]